MSQTWRESYGKFLIFDVEATHELGLVHVLVFDFESIYLTCPDDQILKRYTLIRNKIGYGWWGPGKATISLREKPLQYSFV